MPAYEMGRWDLGDLFHGFDDPELARARGATLVNVDATVLAQAPRLAPHIPLMQANLAPILGLTPAEVNIKATTTEHMGFAGRGEGMAAYAVVLVTKT